jgi:hypothetical protein
MQDPIYGVDHKECILLSVFGHPMDPRTRPRVGKTPRIQKPPQIKTRAGKPESPWQAACFRWSEIALAEGPYGMDAASRQEQPVFEASY